MCHLHGFIKYSHPFHWICFWSEVLHPFPWIFKFSGLRKLLSPWNFQWPSLGTVVYGVSWDHKFTCQLSLFKFLANKSSSFVLEDKTTWYIQSAEWVSYFPWLHSFWWPTLICNSFIWVPWYGKGKSWSVNVQIPPTDLDVILVLLC